MQEKECQLDKLHKSNFAHDKVSSQAEAKAIDMVFESKCNSFTRFFAKFLEENTPIEEDIDNAMPLNIILMNKLRMKFKSGLIMLVIESQENAEIKEKIVLLTISLKNFVQQFSLAFKKNHSILRFPTLKRIVMNSTSVKKSLKNILKIDTMNL